MSLKSPRVGRPGRWVAVVLIALAWGLARSATWAEDKPTPKPPAEKKDEQAEAKPDAKKPPAQPPKNEVLQPLQDLFRRKKKTPGQEQLDKAAEAALTDLANQPIKSGPGRKVPRASMDNRAPSEKRAEDLIHKAKIAIADERWNDALEILQRVASLTDDTLYPAEEGTVPEGVKWVSLHAEAQRLIGRVPPEWLEQYRKQYSGLAKQLLADAVASGSPAEFGRLARTYFHTDAGYEAANRIGSWHLDRNEPALAARWFGLLWQARPALTQSAVWRAKAALALAQVGQTELAREIFDLQKVDVPATAPALGGGSRDAARWLASSPKLGGPLESPLTEWRMFFGSPRRTGVATGGEPLLLPRWQFHLSDRQPVRSQIEHLSQDLAEQGSHPLPLIFPSMVAGKVLVRSLHGVQVLDAETGRELWQTDEFQPLERLIGALGGQDDDLREGQIARIIGNRQVRIVNNNIVHMNGGFTQAEFHPVSHLLFRNANFGLVSSDGTRLFVVDDPQAFTLRQPGNFNNWVDPNQPAPVSSSARLAAFDLESGRPLWEVGGNANGESFDPPLAGYFFFGAPVVDGDDLFIVGESTSGDSSKQIRLICLHPATGAIKWTQLIANSDPDIEKDLCRRWWTAQVTVADGMVICPTTVGWTVAVDRATRNLLWGHRFAVGLKQPVNQFGANTAEIANLVPMWQLKDMWGPAPPVAVAGKVLFSSPEGQSFVCLDQATGKEQWTKPRGTALYFAGVHGPQVIVVGRDWLGAWDLANGNELWPNIKLPAPSGRGVLLGDQYYLPVSSGEIWIIQLQSGQVAGKLTLPDQQPAGNLAMYHGMLLAADAHGITAFEQRDTVQAEIVRRKQADPTDAWALIREAQIHALKQDQAAALALLRQVPRDRIPEELRETFRSLIVKALTEAIQKDLLQPSNEADLADLATLVRTEVERQNLQKQEADLFLSKGQPERAFDIYLRVAAARSVLVSQEDLTGVDTRADLWAAAKIDSLYARLSPAEQAVIDQRIDKLRDEAQGSEEAQVRFLQLFRQRPQALAVRRDLAEAYASRGEFLAAERLLRQLSQCGQREFEAAALERLARLLLEFKLPEEAAAAYRVLEQRYADVPVGGTANGAAFVAALRDAGKFPEWPTNTLDWHADSIRVERHGLTGFSNNSSQLQELHPHGSTAPFFHAHRLEVEITSQRLDVIDGFSDELYWSVPLRSRLSNNDGSQAFGRAAVHQLNVLHQGVLHALSPVDRRVLWTRPAELRSGGNINLFSRNLNSQSDMQTPANLANRQAQTQALQAMPQGLCLAGEEVVGSLGRRSLTMIDALSGETAWVYNGVRSNSIVLGGDQVVYIRPPDGQNCVALRAVDGRKVEAKNLDITLNRFVHLVRDRFVMSGLPKSKTGLRLYDPIRDQDVWTVELAPEAKISLLDRDRAAILTPDGTFTLLDLQTGSSQPLAQIPADEFNPRTNAFVVADRESLFLLLNKNPITHNSTDQIPFLRANGTMLSFDLRTGKQRWKQPVQGKNLLLERLASSPFLLFSQSEFRQKGKVPVWTLNLLAIDKLTGTKLLDLKTVAQPGFRALIVNAAERYVELRSFSERLRLYPAERLDSSGQEGGD
ncbi:MAG: PQQ-binding-like beta-propeller repeat protein [Planctomycetes bacterium]|nr:PQQ-binding-like beta-propeller repeat protein [Planctomycetota bacterium]